MRQAKTADVLNFCMKIYQEKAGGGRTFTAQEGLSGQPEDAARTGFTEEAGLTIEAAWNPFTPTTPGSAPIPRLPLTAPVPPRLR